MDLNWVDGFRISADVDGDTARIVANTEGLISLANILLALAEESPGAHLHLDEYNSLEDGSVELVIEKA